MPLAGGDAWTVLQPSGTGKRLCHGSLRLVVQPTVITAVYEPDQGLYDTCGIAQPSQHCQTCLEASARPPPVSSISDVSCFERLRIRKQPRVARLVRRDQCRIDILQRPKARPCKQ